MLVRWTDLGRDWGALDEFRRRMDSLFHDYNSAWRQGVSGGRTAHRLGHATWPRINMYDAEDQLILEAEVPGLGAEDLEITNPGSREDIRPTKDRSPRRVFGPSAGTKIGGVFPESHSTGKDRPGESRCFPL